MNYHAIFDVAGPRTQRRIRIITALSVILILGVLGYAYWLFYSTGVLAPSKWVAFTDPGVIRYLADALRNTMLAALMAAVIALPLGALLAVARLSSLRVLKYPATIVIEFFRAVPVLLVIYVFMFALPHYGLNFSNFWRLVIPIGLCAAAVMAEVFRAGVLAVPRGQSEAGLAIGLTDSSTMRFIVFPQAIRMIIPALIAQFVVVVKDTAFGYVVSYHELMESGKVMVANSGDLIQTYLVITVIYIAVNIAISRTAQALDSHLSRRRSGSRTAMRAVFK